MFLVWLFWLFVLLGGGYMTLEALRALAARGFDLGVAANALVWLGCAIAAVPRVWRLVTGMSGRAAH